MARRWPEEAQHEDDLLPGRKSEVDDCDLGRDLRGVVRVWQVAGDVHLEVSMVWNYSVSQFNHYISLLLVSLK